MTEVEMEHAQAVQNDEHPNRILLVFDDLATDGIS